jgi:hypothetical protein
MRPTSLMVGIDFGDDFVEFALGNVARDAFVEQAPVVFLEPEAQPFEIGRCQLRDRFFDIFDFHQRILAGSRPSVQAAAPHPNPLPIECSNGERGKSRCLTRICCPLPAGWVRRLDHQIKALSRERADYAAGRTGRAVSGGQSRQRRQGMAVTEHLA